MAKEHSMLSYIEQSADKIVPQSDLPAEDATASFYKRASGRRRYKLQDELSKSNSKYCEDGQGAH